MSVRERIAGAPISWGVIEIPDWGYQMPADRLLREASSIGLTAMEAGPEVFLPPDPAEVKTKLAEHGLRLVGGFVPAVLHEPGVRREGLDLVERRAKFFSAAGADTLVLAATTGSESYEEIIEFDETAWRELFENLDRAEEICARHGLTLALHSHYGTVVETDDQLRRFLEGSETGLCLDTGHLVIGGSDPVLVAEEAADRVKHVHLKDVDREVARRLGAREIDFKAACREKAFRPLGEGDVDVGRLLEVLEGTGYSGWYVLEQDTVVEEEPEEAEGPILDVRKSLAFVEKRLDGGAEG
ncbi:MAG: TIM barrel protein [Actinomycetota bacterium]